MNRIVRVTRMQFRDIFTWFVLPFLILFFNFAVNYFSAYINNGMDFNFGCFLTIVLYAFVQGIIIVKETYPFSIGLGTSRSDYFFGTALAMFIISVVTSLLLVLLGLLENNWTQGWGVGLLFFYMPLFDDLNFFKQIAFYLIPVFLMYSFGVFIQSIHRKFGTIGIYVFFLIIAILGSILSYALFNFDIWHQLTLLTIMEIVMIPLPFILVFNVGAFMLLRRASA